MDEGKKKPIMIGIAVVCLAIAAFVIVKRTGKMNSGDLDMFKHDSIWVKCTNPDCGAEYEMNKQEYFQEIEDNVIQGLPTGSVKCQQCEKREALRAEKCEKCGTVFPRGAALNLGISQTGGYIDECPECHYSRTLNITEQLKKKKAQQ